MTEMEAIPGTRVRTTRKFYLVPNGSTGTIYEDYGTGVMIVWDHDPTLKDGFDKMTELDYLEVLQ